MPIETRQRIESILDDGDATSSAWLCPAMGPDAMGIVFVNPDEDWAGSLQLEARPAESLRGSDGLWESNAAYDWQPVDGRSWGHEGSATLFLAKYGFEYRFRVTNYTSGSVRVVLAW